MLSRRLFLLAAPAIVAAPSLMRVSALTRDIVDPLRLWHYETKPVWPTARPRPGLTQYAWREMGWLTARESEIDQIARDCGYIIRSRRAS